LDLNENFEGLDTQSKNDDWHMIFERVKFYDDKRKVIPTVISRTINQNNA